MPVPATAGERRDRHATLQGPPLGEPGALERVVAAAVVAAICEEAGRVVTPDEVLAVIRALRAKADGRVGPRKSAESRRKA